jgi:hypothetical protein
MKTRIFLGVFISLCIIIVSICLFSYSENLFVKFLNGEIDLEIQEITFEVQGSYFKLDQEKSIEYFKARLRRPSDCNVGSIYRRFNCYIKINSIWTKGLDVMLHKNRRCLIVGNNDIWKVMVFDDHIPDQIMDLIEFLSK